MRVHLTIAPLLATLCASATFAQAPDLNAIPPYKKELNVVGGLRIAGSELKGVVDLLAEGFRKFQPDAKVSTNFMTSSEGALGMMIAGVSDVAPMGDDAKITDQMPFFNAFGYVPTEISIATGGYDKRGTLFAWAIVVNKANPLARVSIDQLDRIFGSERTGGWEIGANAANNLLFTAKHARRRDGNIRTWGQLGLKGDYADKEIPGVRRQLRADGDALVGQMESQFPRIRGDERGHRRRGRPGRREPADVRGVGEGQVRNRLGRFDARQWHLREPRRFEVPRLSGTQTDRSVA